MATKPTPSKSTALQPWEQDMIKSAQAQAKAEKVIDSFKKISTKSGTLSVDDIPVKGNTMDIVVLCSVFENTMYAVDYDPGTPQVPICYAFSEPYSTDPEGEMVPHAEAEEPQSDACATCAQNVMGTAERGRGKACKNVRRLLVIAADDIADPETLAAAEMRALSIPVMSTKGWAKYVKETLADLELPYWAVVTNITVVPDPKSQFRILFEFVEAIEFDSDIYEAMKKRISEAEEKIGRPYPKAADLVQAPPQRGRGVPMKPVGRAAVAVERNTAKPGSAPPRAAAGAKRKF